MSGERVIADLVDIVPFVLEHARFVGPGLLVAAVLVRAFLRAFSLSLFALGALFVAYLTLREWQISHNLLDVGVILGAGLGLSGILAWSVRALSLVVSLALFAGGSYLLVYGWMGPDFIGTGTGVATWAAATALVGLAAGRLRTWRRVGLAVRLAAGAAAL